MKKDGNVECMYALYRQDDNGNVFLIQKNLSRSKATDLMKEYEARGHKQTCWVCRQLTDGKISEK
ncbi:MAG: hypothetical protein ACRBF0_20475 [Calditrichia bacterium]